ncbi:MAG: GCN5-related N-acetyltransferase [Methanocalculus sp. 52_23]|jgi:hypothetical protein|uniref:hypothetical protein n=1 Tax=Methanocalculus sp. TaxID=2004547 RepID=UPI0007496B7C|nr:hypothetical protein [Methanocalculus sp.]KUK69382.1 MAG: GCN5-related N-acetyltransferase [Methanocalculus sp. 52_23]
MTEIIRELGKDEFYLAEKLWREYRGQKVDATKERIIGVFIEKELVATARCTRHPEGLEMDWVFTSETIPGQGFCPYCGTGTP